MKTIRQKLDAAREILEDNIGVREMILEEKWQKIEKAEAFEEKTDELKEVLDNLEMTINALDTFLE